MSKSIKLFKPFILLLLLLTLQSCTCWGIDIGQFFSGKGPAPTNDQGPASGINCSNVRLISPRSNLPNGAVTVTWGALAGAVNYRINVYSGSVLLKSWDNPSPATSLTADMSQSAIGGENPMELELLVIDANGNYCRDYVVLDREQPISPTHTPTATARPSILANKVSYCTPAGGKYYINLPLNDSTEPKIVQSELLDGKLKLQTAAGDPISCTIDVSNRLLTCVLSNTIKTPAEINVIYGGSTIDSVSFDGYCPETQRPPSDNTETQTPIPQ